MAHASDPSSHRQGQVDLCKLQAKQGYILRFCVTRCKQGAEATAACHASTLNTRVLGRLVRDICNIFPDNSSGEGSILTPDGKVKPNEVKQNHKPITINSEQSSVSLSEKLCTKQRKPEYLLSPRYICSGALEPFSSYVSC